MKKIVIVFAIFHASFFASAQENFPSYPEVLRYYFARHAAVNDYQNTLNFAKKKEGWYVQKVNQFNDYQVLSEEPFWLKKDGKYLDTGTVIFNQNDIDNTLETYLTTGSSTYDWYCYERCRYYGYNGWDADMINDYGNKNALSDTLLDGLMRAYDFHSGRYTWYQYGGSTVTNDPLQKKLDRLEYPSTERLLKAKYYLEKAIETAKRLRVANRDYITRVGNADMQVFNDQMNGYNQMIMALQDKDAKEFIDKTTLDIPYINQAKNYLNSCPKNTILFTYGDNDTYPLWYVQEKEHYRKDITVINTSLLGLPIYLEMLKKTNAVNFSATSAFYKNKLSDVSYYYKKDEAKEPPMISLSLFVKQIINKTYTTLSNNGDTLTTYSCKKLFFDKFSKDLQKDFLPDTNSRSAVIIKLSDYVYINDFMVMDIINENEGIRPIYFSAGSYTTYFDNKLQQEGICFKLSTPEILDNDSAKKETVKRLQDYVDKIYKTPLLNYYNQKIVSIDGNGSFFYLYAVIANYYIGKMDNQSAQLWLNKALTEASSITEVNMPDAYLLIQPLLSVDDLENAKNLTEKYASFLYNRCMHPNAMRGILTKTECKEQLQYILNTLEDKNINSPLIEKMISNLDTN